MPLSAGLPKYDIQAYRKYIHYQHLYDKLYIAESQRIRSGDGSHEPQSSDFPLFVKPRYGHKTNRSKNCKKVNTINQYRHYMNKPDMIWTEFLPENEGMSDILMHNGKIMHDFTYLYLGVSHGNIADEWKLLSPSNTLPEPISKWVETEFDGFTGVCNIQYRGDKIIEVCMRLARGGLYLQMLQNDAIVKAINDLIDHKKWDYNLPKETFDFEPLYMIKCYTTFPIVYKTPIGLGEYFGCSEYFEHSGDILGSTFCQIFDTSLENGLERKNRIENITIFIQLLFIFLVLKSIYTFDIKFMAVLTMFYFTQHIRI